MNSLIVFIVLCTFSGVQLAAVQNGCPDGVNMVYCFANPCAVLVHKHCAGYPDATCVPNYCGGCHAYWYDPDGSRVYCNHA